MIKNKKSFNLIRCCRKNENCTVNFGSNLSTDVLVSLVISLYLEKCRALNLTTKTPRCKHECYLLSCQMEVRLFRSTKTSGSNLKCSNYIATSQSMGFYMKKIGIAAKIFLTRANPKSPKIWNFWTIFQIFAFKYCEKHSDKFIVFIFLLFEMQCLEEKFCFIHRPCFEF